MTMIANIQLPFVTRQSGNASIAWQIVWASAAVQTAVVDSVKIFALLPAKPVMQKVAYVRANAFQIAKASNAVQTDVVTVVNLGAQELNTALKRAGANAWPIARSANAARYPMVAESLAEPVLDRINATWKTENARPALPIAATESAARYPTGVEIPVGLARDLTYVTLRVVNVNPVNPIAVTEIAGRCPMVVGNPAGLAMIFLNVSKDIVRRCATCCLLNKMSLCNSILR